VLSRTLTFSRDQDDSFFQGLPAAASVFLLRGEGEPYISKTANLRRRLQRLLGLPSEHSKRLNLRDRVREIEFTLTGSDFESQFLLYTLLRRTFPKTYAARLRLRPAPLVKLHLENEYPRASVTRRLGKLQKKEKECGETGVSPVPQDASCTGEDARASKKYSSNLYYGPFPSRSAAEKFTSDALDFFKMRRCVEDLHPDPAFPGCVYSEMKMCLAPCFKGCTDSDYHAEVARVQAFFDTSGESLSREFAEQRERASAELAFEEAAAIHAKLDKLKPLLAQLPEIVQRIDRLQAIVVQPSPEPISVSLFHFAEATLHGPYPFNVELRAESQSMESRVEAAIAGFPPRDAHSTAERIEHLAILKRWFYRSHRVGEIFFAEANGSWPLRRIVRGIGRIYKGEQSPRPVAFYATPGAEAPS
jgi:excinuclease ABC subunit C